VLGTPVGFADDCVGAPAEQAIAAMKNGDVIVLENTRYHAAEEKNDPAFAAQLAALADLFVNDAFSAAHRAHASTAGVAHLLPAYAGRLMQAELEALRRKTDEQAKQIEDLKAQNGEAWLTEQRASQIRGIVGDVLGDSAGRASLRTDGALAGYDRNFFIASADGIEYLESQSAQNLSIINVHLKLNYDTNAALTQIQAKVAQVRNNLPPEAEAPEIELTLSDTQFAQMYISFASDDLDPNQLTDYLIRVVQPKLTAVSGVQKADSALSPITLVRCS
jgi:hypothetical protein